MSNKSNIEQKIYKYPEYVKKRALTLYLLGVKPKDISEKLGCSRSSVYNWKYNLIKSMKSMDLRLTEEDIKKAVCYSRGHKDINGNDLSVLRDDGSCVCSNCNMILKDSKEKIDAFTEDLAYAFEKGAITKSQYIRRLKELDVAIPDNIN